MIVSSITNKTSITVLNTPARSIPANHKEKQSNVYSSAEHYGLYENMRQGVECHKVLVRIVVEENDSCGFASLFFTGKHSHYFS